MRGRDTEKLFDFSDAEREDMKTRYREAVLARFALLVKDEGMLGNVRLAFPNATVELTIHNVK